MIYKIMVLFVICYEIKISTEESNATDPYSSVISDTNKARNVDTIDVDDGQGKDTLNMTKETVTADTTTKSRAIYYNISQVTSEKMTPATPTTESSGECYQLIEEMTGRIQSSLHTDHDKILQCYWIITVPQGHVVRLKFRIFNLPPVSANGMCSSGFVQFGSFDSQGRMVMGYESCGETLPDIYHSLGNRCWIYYQLTRQDQMFFFDLVFDAISTEQQEDSKLEFLAFLLLILPGLVGVFVYYVWKRRKTEQRKRNAEAFDRFKQKHLRNKTLLLNNKKSLTKKQDGERSSNSIKIKVSKPSDDHDKEEVLRRYFESNVSSIKPSGAYEMGPGNFFVQRVIMPSTYSDGSVFLHDTPDALEKNHLQRSSLSNDNFLTIPNKFSQRDPLPSYMSFREHNSIANSCYDPNRRQTFVSMGTSEMSLGSLDSIDEIPSYPEPPPYASRSQMVANNSQGSMEMLRQQGSDTSVFSNEHPRILDRKKKRRKYGSSPFAGYAHRRQSKNYSPTYCSKRRFTHHTPYPYINSASRSMVHSYRPGTGHPAFLSSSSIKNINNLISSTNLQKGKWDDVNCLNETDLGSISLNQHYPSQNMGNMSGRCQTMPNIQQQSYASNLRDVGSTSFSMNHARNELENSMMSHNENMSLINEEDISGNSRKFDNPAFSLDESPEHDNKHYSVRRSYSVDYKNKSNVDINNNTQMEESMMEAKSFIVNEFDPGDNRLIVLDQGETMV